MIDNLYLRRLTKAIKYILKSAGEFYFIEN